MITSNTRYQINPTTEGDNIVLLENFDHDQDFSLRIGNIRGPFGTLYFKRLRTEGLFELTALCVEGT